MNPLRELKRYGQSVWLDNIRRGLITSGELQRLIDEDGLAGVTANPSIFEKAIAQSRDYDALISQMRGKSPTDIYEAIAFEDVGMAADLFKPLYEQTQRGDGYVSIEVLASLANDTQGSIRDARRYWDAVNRKNIMVKIPATKEGLHAIEESLANGININITLIFSIERYLAVAEAYVRALERRVEKGQPIDHLASVASFFVSRVDTLADKLITQKLAETTDPATQEKLRSLLGKIAIANSKVAYEHYKRIFHGERFARLSALGARPQRVLWASTSTKNPQYPDTYYVDELIGSETINTIPPETMKLFREHGIVRPTLEKNVAEAHAVLKRLAAVGVSLDAITYQLEVDGVKQFDDAYQKLLKEIEQKKKGSPSPLIDPLLREKRDEILRIAAKHGAYNVRVFGSRARGEADAQSDVDFLVRLERGRSLFDLGGLLMALQETLGRPVDVVTEQGLRERIRERVLREAVSL